MILWKFLVDGNSNYAAAADLYFFFQSATAFHHYIIVKEISSAMNIEWTVGSSSIRKSARPNFKFQGRSVAINHSNCLSLQLQVESGLMLQAPEVHMTHRHLPSLYPQPRLDLNLNVQAVAMNHRYCMLL